MCVCVCVGGGGLIEKHQRKGMMMMVGGGGMVVRYAPTHFIGGFHLVIFSLIFTREKLVTCDIHSTHN